MGAGHGHKLHFHGHSPLHRAPAHLKILALLAFMILVVATPRDWYAAYSLYLAMLVVAIGVSRVPPTYILKRTVVELPFVVFALLLPFVATGPQTEVLGVSVSASLTLAATTEPQDILAGLERLRLPSQLVQIMAFMVRYLDVVTGEMQRMKVARESRGFTARDPRHWPVLARSAGALFIRSYERGERVHLAMLSRGYTGKLPR
jgi:cobalt/nickel transport system permease protein